MVIKVIIADLIQIPQVIGVVAHHALHLFKRGFQAFSQQGVKGAADGEQDHACQVKDDRFDRH